VRKHVRWLERHEVARRHLHRCRVDLSCGPAGARAPFSGARSDRTFDETPTAYRRTIFSIMFMAELRAGSESPPQCYVTIDASEF
jgi:hypothetical protein